MTDSSLVIGPTFEEMLHPWHIDPATRQRAQEMSTQDPLDPINLYNITWRDHDNRIYYEVLPPQLTGVDAPITKPNNTPATYTITPLLCNNNQNKGPHNTVVAIKIRRRPILSDNVPPIKPPIASGSKMLNSTFPASALE